MKTILIIVLTYLFSSEIAKAQDSSAIELLETLTWLDSKIEKYVPDNKGSDGSIRNSYFEFDIQNYIIKYTIEYYDNNGKSYESREIDIRNIDTSEIFYFYDLLLIKTKGAARTINRCYKFVIAEDKWLDLYSEDCDVDSPTSSLEIYVYLGEDDLGERMINAIKYAVKLSPPVYSNEKF